MECVICSHNSSKTWGNESLRGLKKIVVGKQGPDDKVKHWNIIGLVKLLSGLHVTGVKKTYQFLSRFKNDIFKCNC